VPVPQDTADGDALRPLRPLRDAVREERRRIAISASGAVGHQTCEALVPVVIGATVDRAIAPGDGGALALWIGLLVLLFVVLTMAYRTQLTAGERAIEHTQHRMRMRMTRRTLDPVGLDPTGAPDDVVGSTGALVSVAGTDARTAALGIEGVVVALGAVAAIGVSAVVLLTISLPLGLLVLLGAPPVVLLLQRVAVPIEARSEEQQARAADASAVATDLLTGVRVLKGLGAEATAETRASPPAGRRWPRRCPTTSWRARTS
jgi:putative ABC transport system ATP-binding protein